jgi:hypothetical protein
VQNGCDLIFAASTGEQGYQTKVCVSSSQYLLYVLRRTAIGNSAWPIGLTMVGIHERSGREKISTSKVRVAETLCPLHAVCVFSAEWSHSRIFIYDHSDA